jgi:hypothetical protein
MSFFEYYSFCFQAVEKDEREKINSKSIFDPKLFKDEKFWFTKGWIKFIF